MRTTKKQQRQSSLSSWWQSLDLPEFKFEKEINKRLSRQRRYIGSAISYFPIPFFLFLILRSPLGNGSSIAFLAGHSCDWTRTHQGRSFRFKFIYPPNILFASWPQRESKRTTAPKEVLHRPLGSGGNAYRSVVLGISHVHISSAVVLTILVS